ncbi:YjcB family protein [Mixta calida]|nr:YjcB family protein [Mixta calida]
MATLTASLVVMRWELLSAVLMFFASTFKTKCRQTSHPVMAFLFSGIGVGVTCWFVAGLLGMTFSMENMNNFLNIMKEAFINIMNQTPPEWPMPMP